MFFPFVPLYSAGLRAPTRTHPARSRSLALRLRLPCVAGPEPAADGKERSEGANGGAGWGIHPLKACHSHYVHPFLSSRYFFFICVVFFPPPPSDVSPVQRCRCSRGCGAVAGCGARCCGVRSVGEARGRALRGWMGCSQRCVSCRRFRSVVLNPDRALGSVPRQPSSPSFPPTPPTCSSPLGRCPMATMAGRAAAGRPSQLFSASFQEEEKSGASRAGLGRGGRWRGGKLKITPKAACLPPPPTAPCSGSVPRVRG